jgi:ABC-type sugar transport system permease subunit
VPLLAVFLVFQVWPIISLFNLSFREWQDVLARKPSFVGLANFQRLVKDPAFWQVLGNTFKFTALRVPIGMVLGLVFALAIDHTRHLRGLYVGAFFSPYMVSAVSMAFMFTYFFQPQYGLFNFVLGRFGIPSQRFLLSTTQALPSIVFVDLWKNFGFTMVIFLAGLQSIPREFHESAAVSGAGAWQTFWRITFPMLTPTTFLMLLTNVIVAMRVFVPVFVMTSLTAVSRGSLGGPLNSTNVFAVQMYQEAFNYSDFTYAAAVGVVLFIIVFALTILQLRTLRVRWEY